MQLKVINTSTSVVERLGFRFEPGVVQTIEVNSNREYIAVSAAKPLEVEKIEEVKEEKPKKRGKKKVEVEEAE